MDGRLEPDNNILLLSIDEKFANQIYSGEKPYEFRKLCLPENFSSVYLMENESQKITGKFEVEKIHKETISQLWEKFGKGISEYERFHNYYGDWDVGIAIEIGKIKVFDDGISIEKLNNSDINWSANEDFDFVYLNNELVQMISRESSIRDGSVSSKNNQRVNNKPSSVTQSPFETREIIRSSLVVIKSKLT